MVNGNGSTERGTYVDGLINWDNINDPEHRRQMAFQEVNHAHRTDAQAWLSAIAGHPMADEIAKIREEALGQSDAEKSV
jgi:hypothetical protein